MNWFGNGFDETHVIGPSLNPYDLAYQPGGSSNGVCGAMAAWLAASHVYEWWLEEFEEPKYRAIVDGTDPEKTEGFVIVVDGRDIGFIQRYRHADDPEWDAVVGIPNAAGIDYLIGEPSLVGRGIGTEMISRTCPLAVEELGVEEIVAITFADNARSYRAFLRCGFTTPGVVEIKGRPCYRLIWRPTSGIRR